MTASTSQQRSELADVVIAISAFRSDRSVMALLEAVFAAGGREAARVIVVDSLSDGSLEQLIRQRGWPVDYENAEVNLGSAGNLARRLELAALQDAQWCYTINHDGMFDRLTVETMVRCGRSASRVGAVFPRRVMLELGGKVLQPHLRLFDMPRYGPSGSADDEPLQVAWDSSNGALYSLQPVRGGIVPWADLWLGWEDLAYGWQLSSRGWKQLRCKQAEFHDDYEYQAVSLLAREFRIARKPAWYGYYQIRNLILILRRTRAGPDGWLFLVRRLLRELSFAILFRSHKRERLKMLLFGLIDGVRGITCAGRGRSA